MTQAMPGYAPTYPPQYAPAGFPGYPPQQAPPQGYPQQFAPQFVPPAPAPLAQGTLDDFYNQPGAGGSKSLVFPAVGTVYIGIVERPIGNGDVQQQVDFQTKAPLFFRDGRPKFVMRVPLQMQPNPAYPDGRATWFVKGADRDELARAMAEVGAPEGAPEHGAIIRIAYTGDQQSGAGMNPRKVKQVAYTRPNGAPPVTATAAPSPAAVAPQAPQFTGTGYPAPQQSQAHDLAAQQLAQAAQIAQAQLGATPVQQPDPAAAIAAQMQANAAQYAAQQAAPAPQPPAPAPAAAPAPPASLSPEQQALIAKLGG